jgi:O-antigen ligase
VGFGAFEKTFERYREGYLSTLFSYSAHNTFLRTLAETGIVGFIPFMAFVFLIMRSLWRAFRNQQERDERTLLVAMMFSLSTFWLMSMTLDQIFEPHFWVVYGVGLYMIEERKS